MLFKKKDPTLKRRKDLEKESDLLEKKIVGIKSAKNEFINQIQRLSVVECTFSVTRQMDADIEACKARIAEIDNELQNLDNHDEDDMSL